MLDIKGALARHEEAKELVVLLTTEARDDPEIRAQVALVRLPAMLDAAIAANSPNRAWPSCRIGVSGPAAASFPSLSKIMSVAVAI